MTSGALIQAGKFSVAQEKGLRPGTYLLEISAPDLEASLISNEDASAFLPPGFRLGEAFALPFALESIQCLPGTVKIVQRATAPLK